MTEPIDNTEENWLPVVGYEGYYSVSSYGRVRSERTKKNTYTGRNVKPLLTKAGYLRVCLTKDGQIKKCCHSVHALVLAAFKGPRAEGIQINHISGVKTDNNLKNLSYCTASENMLHSCRVLGNAVGAKHGSRTHPERVPRGERSGPRLHPERMSRGYAHKRPMAKVTEKEVIEIREKCAAGTPQKVLAEFYGLKQSSVSFIVNRKNWKHVL